MIKESEVFIITCSKCNFSGAPNKFEISAEVCDCGSCSGGAEITISCIECGAEMEMGNW